MIPDEVEYKLDSLEAHDRSTAMKRCMAALAALASVTCVALAERPPENPKDAHVIVTGELTDISPKEEKVGQPNKDGILTDFTAELKVSAVQKGEGIKVGDTIKITWMQMTKKPSGRYVGASGHDYKVKKGDTVTAYLMKRGDGVLEVAYDQKGMVKK